MSSKKGIATLCTRTVPVAELVDLLYFPMDATSRMVRAPSEVKLKKTINTGLE